MKEPSKDKSRTRDVFEDCVVVPPLMAFVVVETFLDVADFGFAVDIRYLRSLVGFRP